MTQAADGGIEQFRAGGRCWEIWTRPPRRTGWPCPPGWSATPVSGGLTLGGGMG